MCRYLILVIVIYLGGCQNRASNANYHAVILHDEAFAGFEQYEIETREEIFALSDDAKDICLRIS